MGEFWGGKRYVIFKICVIFEKGSSMFKTKKIRGSPMRWVSNEKGSPIVLKIIVIFSQSQNFVYIVMRAPGRI